MTKPKPDEKRIPDDLIDQLLANYEKPEDLTGETGILKQLTARLIERAMQAEMTEHLGYEKHAPAGRGLPNSRNGTRTKALKTEQGEVEIEVPRDRDGTFEPQLVKKRQTHFTGFDERILALYARGMTVRDIQGHPRFGVVAAPRGPVALGAGVVTKASEVRAESERACGARPGS